RGGVFTVTVTIYHETAPPVTVIDTVNAGAPITGAGGFTINGVEGQPLVNVPVAAFTGGIPGACTATINWGDGTTSAGTITGPDVNGVFVVTGSHTYKEESTPAHTGGSNGYTVTTTINCPNMAPATVTSVANIAEAPLIASGVGTITGTGGQPLSNVVVATFKDTGGAEDAGDYTATVNWGDGTTSVGTVSGPDGSGTFTVRGSHTYAAAGGTFTITVTIFHETLAAATVTDVASIGGRPITSTGGVIINGVEGQPLVNVPVAVFTGGNSNCTA